MMWRDIHTLGDLKASGYRSTSIRDEMRRNLIAAMRARRSVFSGIIGYDETVIPQVQNAILSGQDIIFLGERGQAKSRIMRSLVSLLDERVPLIAGCEINDDPLAPACKHCRERVAREGDATPVDWLPRQGRYGEKLATPDCTIADLIGDIDPIKVAEGRYLSDEMTIHYGLIPRTNRGIFCINELPDLAERIQVGLFNLMEERDIQIRGYHICLPLDVFLVASANPEDYTNRGRIITPLKDRYGAQVRTHYPASVEDEITIMEMERRSSGDELDCLVPDYMKQIIATITHLARKSPDINQRSGVSVRVSIANYETIISNAVRRAVLLDEKIAVPRLSDLPYIRASMTGKLEIESFEDNREEKIIEELSKKAVQTVFGKCYQLSRLETLVAQFANGVSMQVSDMMGALQYVGHARQIPGMLDAVRQVNDHERPETIAAAIEFVLEGLHVNSRLNKSKVDGKTVYRR